MAKERDSITELDTLYKLMILYMLDSTDQFMTKAQISEFILSRGYTDYFNLNIIINEMIDTELIRSKTKRNHINLEITEEGRRTLGEFSTRVSEEIKKELRIILRKRNTT